jgi:hypothetical protein
MIGLHAQSGARVCIRIALKTRWKIRDNINSNRDYVKFVFGQNILSWNRNAYSEEYSALKQIMKTLIFSNFLNRSLINDLDCVDIWNIILVVIPD